MKINFFNSVIACPHEGGCHTGLTRFVLFFVLNLNSSDPEDRNVYSTP